MERVFRHFQEDLDALKERLLAMGGLAEERVREASLRGCAAGALACTDYGAMRALPTKEELKEFMEANQP